MTIFLLLLFDHFFGRGILAGTPWTLAAGIAAGLVEFHYKGWVQYAAVMRLRDAREFGLQNPHRALTREQVTLGKLTLVIGLLWDFLLMLIACVWLLDPPREFTLSQKLDRLAYGGARWGWQRDRAVRFRMRLLDNVDSRGVHHT